MKRTSQKQQILEYMIRQMREPIPPITPWIAAGRFGCLRLSQRIIELEDDDGYVIDHAWHKGANGQRVMSYRLISTKRRSR